MDMFTIIVGALFYGGVFFLVAEVFKLIKNRRK